MFGTGRFRVLLVEDQPELADTVQTYLGRYEFEVVRASSGHEARTYFRAERPDIVILDLGLPDTDGTLILGEFATERVPVVVVTGRADEVDRVVGLELGAVDYVTKPFSLRELLARLRTHLRHHGWAEPVLNGTQPDVHRLGPYVVDASHRELRDGERRVELTAAEFDLLLLLLENDTVSRDDIATRVLRKPFNPGDRSVDQLVYRLRAGLGELPWGAIESVRGIGYRLLRA